jgi:hypothetical protein
MKKRQSWTRKHAAVLAECFFGDEAAMLKAALEFEQNGEYWFPPEGGIRDVFKYIIGSALRSTFWTKTILHLDKDRRNESRINLKDVTDISKITEKLKLSRSVPLFKGNELVGYAISARDHDFLQKILEYAKNALPIEEPRSVAKEKYQRLKTGLPGLRGVTPPPRSVTERREGAAVAPTGYTRRKRHEHHDQQS